MLTSLTNSIFWTHINTLVIMWPDHVHILFFLLSLVLVIVMGGPSVAILPSQVGTVFFGNPMERNTSEDPTSSPLAQMTCRCNAHVQQHSKRYGHTHTHHWICHTSILCADIVLSLYNYNYKYIILIII